MENIIETKELNIQPQAGVLGVFSRLNYKPWYAIAEFVDNSTQSFYSHQRDLAEHGITDVEIYIKYDADKGTLTIRDSAYGMEFDDFARAVKLDSPPIDKSGRNEFGMGLKTAASWFGNVWSVRSTQFGSNIEYYTEVNIPFMRDNNINTISIDSSRVDPSLHGTEIVIRDVTKRIDSPRTKSKIMDILKSMYRRDLNGGKVRIRYDGDLLYFKEYECLSWNNKFWKEKLDFSFEFDGLRRRVTGFVGILSSGSFLRAGFALFRRNRVVIGGDDCNYKPGEIFGQSQSTISHKLFGELDLDDFPINQAKDGFVWDDGLEENFIKSLKSNILDYIKIAKLTVKDRESQDAISKSVSDNVLNKIQDSIGQTFGKQSTQPSLFDSSQEESESLGDMSAYESYKAYQSEQNNLPEVVDDKVRPYVIPYHETKYYISVRWTLGDSSFWIKVNEGKENNSAEVLLNINHPFFKPFSEKEDFKVILEKFAISFILAEIKAKETCNSEGLIPPNAFRTFINIFLKELSDEE